MPSERETLSLIDWISLAGSTWFGSGLLPMMPGTWGTIAGIPLIVVLVLILPPLVYPIAVIAFSLIAIPLAARTAYLYRNHPRLAALNPHAKPVFENGKLQQFIKDPERQKEDPGLIVIDEVAGYAVAMIALRPTITAFILAFLFFRAFDIFKIPPGGLMERIGHGIGIVLDDVVAGAYACLLTHIVFLITDAMNISWLP